jgi:4-diphosphocytidyl-2C-methyl-D-erythritol kinase
MNNTLFISKNGDILKKIQNFIPEEIIVKFKSNTLWIILNVCGDEKNRRPCHIEHSNCWESENATAKYSQGNYNYLEEIMTARRSN